MREDESTLYDLREIQVCAATLWSYSDEAGAYGAEAIGRLKKQLARREEKEFARRQPKNKKGGPPANIERYRLALRLRAKGLTFKEIGLAIGRGDGLPGGVNAVRAQQIVHYGERLIREGRLTVPEMANE